VAAKGGEREKLEHLARYIARPPIATERLALTESGQIRYTLRGDHIALKASWTKGGRPRTIPITNGYQYVLLDQAKELAKGGALIPAHRNYIQQQHRYDRQIRKAGMRKLHGLRHAYAQRRYRQLTGWNCPARGGTPSQNLTPEQQTIDQEARLTISHELGHGRAAITAVYIGT
jgi:hypothetical protein